MSFKSSKQLSIIKNAGLSLSNVPRIASTPMRNTGKLNRLRFVFNDNYPIEAPEVVFVGKVPDHRHIYSNGFICMSVLYDGKLKRLECRNECCIDLQDFDFHVGFCLGQVQTREWPRVHQKGWGKESKGLLLDIWWRQMLIKCYQKFNICFYYNWKLYFAAFSLNFLMSTKNLLKSYLGKKFIFGQI